MSLLYGFRDTNIILNPTQLYENLPLLSGTSSIRLIDLYESKEDSNSPLTGNLRVVSLKDNPRFAALSYVWGQGISSGHRLTCNGCELQISVKCHDALVALRQKYGALTIWVDSICINQQDSQEKAIQIPLMEDIYTYARPAYIWLGNGSERTDRAMHCVELASIQRVRPVGIPWFNGGNGRIPLQDQILMAIRITKLWFRALFVISANKSRELASNFDISDLNELLNPEWLSRAWTFQEIVLACDPIIVCGDRFMSWASFHQGLDYIYDAKPSMEFSPGFVKPKDIYEKQHATSLAGLEPWRDLLRLWEVFPRPIQWTKARSSQSRLTTYQSALQYRRKYTKTSVVIILALIIVTLISTAVPTLFVIAVAELINNVSWFDLNSGTMFVKAVLIILSIGMCTTGIFLIFGGWLNLRYCHLWSSSQGKEVMIRQMIWWPFLILGLLYRKVHRMLSKGASAREQARINMMLQKDNALIIARTIRALRSRHATHAEDKVFALYGILRRTGIALSEPTYDKSLGLIYREFYTNLLSTCPESINLLLDSGIGDLNAASWVPDWSTIHKRNWLPESFVYNPLQNLANRRRNHILTEAGLKVRVSFRGTISFCSAVFADIAPEESTVGSPDLLSQLCVPTLVLHRLLTTIKENGRVLSPYKDIANAVFSAIFADKFRFGNLRPDTSDEEIKLFDQWYQTMHTDFPALDSSLPKDDQEALVQGFLTTNPNVQSFVLACCQRLRGRRGLFFSAEGGIGTGPIKTTEGDWIANVTGVSAPLILRVLDRASRTYQVVGPAYVDGLMQWQERKNSGMAIPVVLQETGHGTGEYVLQGPRNVTIDAAHGLTYHLEGDVQENMQTDRGVVRRMVEADLEEITLV